MYIYIYTSIDTYIHIHINIYIYILHARPRASWMLSWAHQPAELQPPRAAETSSPAVSIHSESVKGSWGAFKRV